jgi:hypothetical protein
MSYEKHKVTTDALDTLGTIINNTQQRDAIHLAVLPIEAGCTLHRGSHVGVSTDGKAYDAGVDFVGVVDPFLVGGVNKGQWFWLVI